MNRKGIWLIRNCTLNKYAHFPSSLPKYTLLNIIFKIILKEEKYWPLKTQRMENDTEDERWTLLHNATIKKLESLIQLNRQLI